MNKMEEKNSLYKEKHSFNAYLLALVLGLPYTLLVAYILRDVWSMFLSGIYPTPSLREFIGVILFSSFFVVKISDEDPAGKKTFNPVARIISATFVVLTGWAMAFLWNQLV